MQLRNGANTISDARFERVINEMFDRHSAEHETVHNGSGRSEELPSQLTARHNRETQQLDHDRQTLSVQEWIKRYPETDHARTIATHKEADSEIVQHQRIMSLPVSEGSWGAKEQATAKAEGWGLYWNQDGGMAIKSTGSRFASDAEADAYVGWKAFQDRPLETAAWETIRQFEHENPHIVQTQRSLETTSQRAISDPEKAHNDVREAFWKRSIEDGKTLQKAQPHQQEKQTLQPRQQRL